MTFRRKSECTINLKQSSLRSCLSIRLDAELENDLGINSLELADLVFLCEEKFSIQIDDDDIKSLITVGDVVKYLEENAANA